MTIAMSHERCLALQDPVGYRQKISRPGFQKRRFCTYLLLVVILSFICNIGRFLEHKVVYLERSQIDFSIARNQLPMPSFNEFPITNKSLFPFVQETELSDNAIFVEFVSWSDFVLRGIMPLILISVLNLKIFMSIRREKAIIGKTLNINDGTKFKNQEIKMATTFLAIVVAFIVCYTLYYLQEMIRAIERVHCEIEND